jgi:DNA-binding GntR family transcriptional regulator
MNKEENKNNQLISKRIFDEIKRRIICHVYPPGQALNEQKLMEEFSVSRTPIREALIRLEIEKFVVIMPRALTMVSQINYKELQNIFETRVFLESLGARLAAERIRDDQLAVIRGIFADFPNENLSQDDLHQMDAKFHRTLYDAMDNPLMADFLGNLLDHCLRLHFSMRNKSDVRIALRETSLLIGALEKRDPDLAEKLMRKHVLDYLEKVKQELYNGN